LAAGGIRKVYHIMEEKLRGDPAGVNFLFPAKLDTLHR